MRYAILVLVVISLYATPAEAFTITHINTSCVTYSTPPDNGISVSGPGIAVGGGDATSGCYLQEGSVPGALIPGETSAITWPISNPAGGVVDGLGLTQTHGCPVTNEPCGYIVFEPTLTVKLPLGTKDDFVTLHGQAYGSGSLQIYNPTSFPFYRTVNFAGIGTGEAHFFRYTLPDGTGVYLLGGAPAASADLTAVPEPSAGLLLGAGLAGLAYWRRKQTA
jgi:hypothetical protein